MSGKEEINLHTCISVVSCRKKLVGHQLCKRKKCAKQNKLALFLLWLHFCCDLPKSLAGKKKTYQDRYVYLLFQFVFKRVIFPTQTH